MVSFHIEQMLFFTFWLSKLSSCCCFCDSWTSYTTCDVTVIATVYSVKCKHALFTAFHMFCAHPAKGPMSVCDSKVSTVCPSHQSSQELLLLPLYLSEYTQTCSAHNDPLVGLHSKCNQGQRHFYNFTGTFIFTMLLLLLHYWSDFSETRVICPGCACELSWLLKGF